MLVSLGLTVAGVLLPGRGRGNPTASSSAQRGNSRAQSSCAYCRQTGHLSNDCPSQASHGRTARAQEVDNGLVLFCYLICISCVQWSTPPATFPPSFCSHSWIWEWSRSYHFVLWPPYWSLSMRIEISMQFGLFSCLYPLPT